MKKIYLLPFLFLLLPFSPAMPGEKPAGAGRPEFSKEITGDQLYQNGSQLMEQEKYSDAVPYFEEAVKRKANFAEAYLNLGICYMKISNFQKARQNLVFAGILTMDEALKQKADDLIGQLPATPEQGKTDVQASGTEEQTGGSLQNEEPGHILGRFGITGAVTYEGFSIQNISSGSLAEKAGLKKGDVILKIGNNPVKSIDETASGLQKFEYTDTTVLLDVFADNVIRETGWPPVVETLLPDADMEKIKSYQASADTSLKNGKNKEAADNLKKILASSIHYPYRSDVYLALAKIYMFEITAYWKNNLPAFPENDFAQTGINNKAKKVIDDKKIETILNAKKILSEGEETYRSGKQYYDMALGCINDAKTELKRNGSKSASNVTTDALNAQLAGINTQYGNQRLKEIQDYSGRLSKEDFTRQIICSAKCWWKQNGNAKTLSYQPLADITIKNASDDTDLNVAGEVQFIDETGKIRDKVSIKFLCPARETNTFHGNSTSTFKQTDVWTMSTRITGFGKNRKSVQFPVAEKPWIVRILFDGMPLWDFRIGP